MIWAPFSSDRAADRLTRIASLRRANWWNGLEVLFWLLPIAGYFAFPDRLPLLTAIATLGLFALSL
ncbi:MAG: hypothetical protein ACREE3_07630, partial [Stellaceae bacterium]